MNIRGKTISISGVIILIATIIIATLCIDDWSRLTVLAFSTMLLTEIVFFGGLIFIEWISEKTEQLITRSSLYVLLSFYLVISILLSILYMVFFKEATTSFVIIQVILLAIITIAIMVSLAVSKSIYKSNEKTMTTLTSVEEMITRLNKLAALPKCAVYSSAIKKLSDNLRFTDVSVNVPEDAEIDGAISTIEIEATIENEDAAETIKETLIHLNSLIAQRKVTSSAAKKGRV